MWITTEMKRWQREQSRSYPTASSTTSASLRVSTRGCRFSLQSGQHGWAPSRIWRSIRCRSRTVNARHARGDRLEEIRFMIRVFPAGDTGLKIPRGSVHSGQGECQTVAVKRCSVYSRSHQRTSSPSGGRPSWCQCAGGHAIEPTGATRLAPNCPIAPARMAWRSGAVAIPTVCNNGPIR